MSENKTFVFGDLEVVLTGKKAERRIAPSGRARTSQKEKVFTLYEITPADKEDGSWKKWVKMSDLYEIVEGEEE